MTQRCTTPRPTRPLMLTAEDFEIMAGTWPGRDWQREMLYPIGHSMRADRIDAEIMVELMLARNVASEFDEIFDLNRWVLSFAAGVPA